MLITSMPRPDWNLRAEDGRRPPGRHLSQLDGIVLTDPQATIGAALAPPLSLLPVITIAEFEDASLRAHFVERVVAHHRLADLFSSDWTQGDLVSFHSTYKLTLMSHSQTAYRRLGRLVAGAATRRQSEVADEYARDLMTTLRIPATRGNHVNVLQHVLGYFKKVLEHARRTELLDLIQRYAASEVSLDVLRATMTRHVRECDVRYLFGQTYLFPHPAESLIHAVVWPDPSGLNAARGRE